jgi:hypothetical protein
MSDEKTFYSDETGVRVTSARLIIENTTYAMANVASVRSAVEDPNRLGPVILIALGVLGVAAEISDRGAALVFGIVLLGGGIAWLVTQKPTYHVRISSSSGEADALSSRRKDYIDRVVQAINEAIIGRG